MVDVEDGVGVEMSYARVMLMDWRRLEASTRELNLRYTAH